MHAPQLLTVTEPHEVPSVTREQACESLYALPVHVPDWHVYIVQPRDCVPLASQVFAKPPHAPNAPHTLPWPHATPSCAATFTQPICASQLPLLHSSVIAEQSRG